jgi:hypothetical protein
MNNAKHKHNAADSAAQKLLATIGRSGLESQTALAQWGDPGRGVQIQSSPHALRSATFCPNA